MFFVLICLTMMGLRADSCGEERWMGCKQDCPTTNGQKWTEIDTCCSGCCASFFDCFGFSRQCRFDCDKCSCPSGYQARDIVTATREGSQQRLKECCQQKCSSEHCTGPWELKKRDTFCEDHECMSNTSECCVYKGFDKFDLNTGDSYVDCYANEGTVQVSRSTTHPVSWEQCRDLAMTEGKPAFGMQFPVTSRPGLAQCVLLTTEHKHMAVRDNRECEQVLHRGKRLGGARKIAVYKTAGKYTLVSRRRDGKSSDCHNLQCTVEAGGVEACAKQCSGHQDCNVFNFGDDPFANVQNNCCLKRCPTPYDVDLTSRNGGYDVYTNGYLFSGDDTIEVVKRGDCEQYGYEFITSEEECKLAALIVGVRTLPFGSCQATFEDRTGDVIQTFVYTGNTEAERDASCCSLCSAHSECEFWVRDRDVRDCWLMKNPGGTVAHSRRRGGLRLETDFFGNPTIQLGSASGNLTPLSGGNDENARNLQACIGECDSDDQCAPGLKCFQRTHGEPVPGCSGDGGGPDWDYCYDPKDSLELSGGDDDDATNLQACTGECDSDDQCAAGLKCFQRDDGETIPGCTGSGSGKDWDYCYDPNWGKPLTSETIFCGTYGMQSASFNPEGTGSRVRADGLNHMICKGKTSTPFQCGSQACAYYYTDVEGADVDDLLTSKKFREGKLDRADQLKEGLKMRRDFNDDYGVFMETWVMAPYTGHYKFRTRSDDASVVYAALTPGTKHAEMIKVVELKGCCEKVTGDVELFWEAGYQYYVYGYMKESKGQDYFDVGMKHVREEWDVVPQTFLAGGGCVSILVQNVHIVGEPEIEEGEENSPIREQTVIGADNCGTADATEVSITQGSTTTISTTWEQTKDESWSSLWGIKAGVSASIETKYKTGWTTKLAGAGGAEATVGVTASVEGFTEQEKSGVESTTNGNQSSQETYSETTRSFTQPGESKSEIIIVGTKYNFRVKWRGESVCLGGDGKARGRIKQVEGEYKSFAYSDISYKKVDGICTGFKYCQPSIETVQAALHLNNKEDIFRTNLFEKPLKDACDPKKGGVDCRDLPIACRDNDEDQARWVYSKYYIEKCSGDFDVNNPCTCNFPITVGAQSNIPTAHLVLSDTTSCTYGLPGSFGYDSIPTSHKDGHRTQSSLSVQMSQ